MTSRTVDPIYLPFTVTTPAGTATASPQSTVLAVTHGRLEVVDVTIPPGHAGLTGLRIELSGAPILPFAGVNNWIIGDDLKEQFELGVEVDTKLVAVTYNLGVNPHSHFLRLRVRQLLSTGPPPPVQLAPLSALNGTLN